MEYLSNNVIGSSINIFGVIRQEVNDFVNNYIEVVPGFNFNQYQTIKRNHLYVNSRFYDQSLFSGREKIFFNISTYRKDTAKYLVGLDTKDAKLEPADSTNEWATLFLEKELHLWMKENHLAHKFNDGADELTTQGSVVVKKTKNGVQIVDLRRLFLDPTVDRIKNSRFITIKHYFTPYELKKEGKKNGWDMKAIDSIIAKKKNQKSFAPQSYENFGMKNPIVSTPYIEVYERYGEVEAEWLGQKGDPIRSLFIVAEPFAIGRSQDQKYEWDEGNVLFKGEWTKDYPFNDCHYRKTRGRWLGVGVIEELYPLQERFNELANQKRVAMEVSAMHLFQTADPTVVDNILTDLQSGDIIKTRTQGSLAPIVNEERNLGAFEMEDKVYNMLADKASFVNDILSGQNVSASMPATNAAIANTNSKSFFKERRQDYAIMWREIFEEQLLPAIVKEISTDHILRFTGNIEELQKLDDDWTNLLVNERVDEYATKTGTLPSPDEVQAIKQDAMMQMKKKGKNRFVNIQKDLYPNLEVEFDFVLDDESEDSNILANNKFQLLTAIGQNPNLLLDPVTRTMIYDYAQQTGINPIKLEIAEASRQNQQQPQQMQPQAQPSQPMQQMMQQNGQTNTK